MVRVLPAALALFVISVGTSIASAANDLNITQQLASSVPGFGSPLPTIGTNVEGGSVFSNFVRFHEDGQFFFKIPGGLIRFEQPEAEPFAWSALFWCGDLTFTGVSDANKTWPNEIGYAGHCVRTFLSDITDGGTSGSQQSQKIKATNIFTDTTSVAAIYLPHTNMFEGTIHKNTDGHVFRYYDSGLYPTISFQGWEAHDEGKQIITGSWSAIGNFEMITPVEAAELITNMDEGDFTKQNFDTLYQKYFNLNHFEEEENNESQAVDNTQVNDAIGLPITSVSLLMIAIVLSFWL